MKGTVSLLSRSRTAGQKASKGLKGTVSLLSRSRRSLVAGAIAVVGLGGLPACGGTQHTSHGDGDGAAREQPPPVADPRTPIEQRRDAACDKLGPKLTACAVEDARANLAAGKIGRAQFDRDTAPAIQHKNTEEFAKACKGTAYSSRQVRVLEVCFREETQCAPLLDCLEHLREPGATKDRGAR